MNLPYFNPTLVQLELELLMHTFTLHTNFNPTLVQLELKIMRSNCRSITGFQSHIGAIRIRTALQSLSQIRKISIPHWCN